MNTRVRHLARAGSVLALVSVSSVALWYWAAITWPSLGLEPWPLRKARFARAAERSRPLIDAITRYAKEHGTPPETLEALVPGYLPRVPRTGLLDYPHFTYARFAITNYSLAWWDLGTRNGKPMSGLWCYVQGDPEHAILALTLDEKHRVVDARVDRMPSGHEQIPFDPDRWKKNERRIEMVRSLPEHTNLMDQGTNEVYTTLGPPDGLSVLMDTPWELKVKCPSSTGFDVFVYWPTGHYPGYLHGGDTEMIGGWAYVHE